MPNFDSLEHLEKYLKNQIKYSLFLSGKQMKKVLEDNIYDEWYRRPKTYKSYGDKTKGYTRTWQLPRAVDSYIEKDNSLNIWIDPDKLTPIETEEGIFNTYMSFDKSTNFGDKSIAEWVTEWIDKGNAWAWMPETGLIRKTEAELSDKNIAEKELVEGFKRKGIDAETI